MDKIGCVGLDAQRGLAGEEIYEVINGDRFSVIRSGFPVRLLACTLLLGIVSACNLAQSPDSVEPVAAVTPPAFSGKTVKNFAMAPTSSRDEQSSVADKSPTEKLKLAMSADHGDAAWICSPSGFGQKSKCRRRT